MWYQEAAGLNRLQSFKSMAILQSKIGREFDTDLSHEFF